jgi:hypothetical protein
MYCLLSRKQGVPWQKAKTSFFAIVAFSSFELPSSQDRAKIEVKLRPAPETVGARRCRPTPALPFCPAHLNHPLHTFHVRDRL